jgi:hypothetical protein
MCDTGASIQPGSFATEQATEQAAGPSIQLGSFATNEPDMTGTETDIVFKFANGMKKANATVAAKLKEKLIAQSIFWMGFFSFIEKATHANAINFRNPGDLNHVPFEDMITHDDLRTYFMWASGQLVITHLTLALIGIGLKFDDITLLSIPIDWTPMVMVQNFQMIVTALDGIIDGIVEQYIKHVISEWRRQDPDLSVLSDDSLEETIRQDPLISPVTINFHFVTGNKTDRHCVIIKPLILRTLSRRSEFWRHLLQFHLKESFDIFFNGPEKILFEETVRPEHVELYLQHVFQNKVDNASYWDAERKHYRSFGRSFGFGVRPAFNWVAKGPLIKELTLPLLVLCQFFGDQELLKSTKIAWDSPETRLHAREMIMKMPGMLDAYIAHLACKTSLGGNPCLEKMFEDALFSEYWDDSDERERMRIQRLQVVGCGLKGLTLKSKMSSGQFVEHFQKTHKTLHCTCHNAFSTLLKKKYIEFVEWVRIERLERERIERWGYDSPNCYTYTGHLKKYSEETAKCAAEVTKSCRRHREFYTVVENEPKYKTLLEFIKNHAEFPSVYYGTQSSQQMLKRGYLSQPEFKEACRLIDLENEVTKRVGC